MITQIEKLKMDSANSLWAQDGGDSNSYLDLMHFERIKKFQKIKYSRFSSSNLENFKQIN